MTFEELIKDEDFVRKIENVKDIDEAAELFREQGVEVTADDLRQAIAQTGEELSEDSLDTVAGGVLLPRAGYELGKKIAKWLLDKASKVNWRLLVR